MYSIKVGVISLYKCCLQNQLTLKGIRQSCLLHIAAISNYMQIFWIMQSALGPHCWKFYYQRTTADDTTEDSTIAVKGLMKDFISENNIG